jgi:hypothetical protein
MKERYEGKKVPRGRAVESARQRGPVLRGAFCFQLLSPRRELLKWQSAGGSVDLCMPTVLSSGDALTLGTKLA